MCAVVDPAVSLSTHSLLPMVSFVDHIDHAAPSASKVVDDGVTRKGTTRSRGRRGSGCPCVEEYEGSLVRCGCEAAVAAE